MESTFFGAKLQTANMPEYVCFSEKKLHKKKAWRTSLRSMPKEILYLTTIILFRVQFANKPQQALTTKPATDYTTVRGKNDRFWQRHDSVCLYHF